MNSDEWIIEKLIIQDEEGLIALIDKYAALLKSVTYKYLYALPAHQEECLNDVFLAIWNNIKQYDNKKSSFKNWICAIARYRSINMLKKYRNDLIQVNWEEHLGDRFPHYDSPLSKELWEIQLEELLSPLSKHDQHLFKDVVESMYSTEELAENHDLTKGALYSRISRGKAKLKDFFFKKGEDYYEK